MKKKITRIWGIGLVVALMASLMVVAIPASAVDNLWDSEITPGPPPYQILAGSNVTDIAVYNDGEEIWAVTGDNWTYKSVDGGVTWTRGNTGEFTSNANPNLIAIAPDTSDVIAVCDTSMNKVFVTNNGGVTWNDLGAITDATAGTTIDTITDMDVSSTRAGQNKVAVSGYNANGEGNIYVFSVGAVGQLWGELKSKAGFNSSATANTVAAIAFSPNYPSDQVMVAVTGYVAGGTTDNILLEIYSFSHSAWNASAGFGTVYPALVVADTTGGTSAITNGSIALDPEYLGSDDILRNSFVGLNLAGTTTLDGIYQMKDTISKGVDTGQTIYSVAYNGANLIAGTTTNTVRYSADPMASVPSFYPTGSLKSPGGANSTVVAWAGTDAVAGTSGANSAFAVSTNNGKSWNDISLITTPTGNSTDVAVTADGSKVYWVSDQTDANGSFVSLYRNDGGWQRILTFADTSNYFVRLAPDDPDVIYLAEKNGDTVYYTSTAARISGTSAPPAPLLTWQSRAPMLPM